MGEAAIQTRGRWPGAAIGAGLGVYAGVVSANPTPGWLLAATAAPALAGVWWWTLAAPNRWVVAFLLTALLSPPLPVAWGGSYLHPALLSAGLGLWAGLARPSGWRLRLDSLTVAVLAFLFVLLATVPLAALYSGAEVAAGSLARVALLGIGVYVFLYVADGPGFADLEAADRALRWVFLAASASALFGCIDFYFQFPAPAGSAEQFVWLPGVVYRRAQGVFYEAGALGNLCACFLLLVAVALFEPAGGRKLLSRPALLAGGVVFAAALLLSFSRSSLVNLAAGLAALLWLRRGWGRWWRPTALLAIGAACWLAATYALFPEFVAYYGERLWGTLLGARDAPDFLLRDRLESWAQLGAFLAESPWHAILGIGYKTLPHSEFVGRPVIADNMYLMALVETGVVGLAALAALLAAILRAARAAARHPDARVARLGTWMFCFWIGQAFQMLSVDVLTYWRLLPLYFLALALAWREARRQPAS